MNKQIKTKWINALRSGEYTQTNGTLRDDKGFCCLGVLCDLYIKENNNIDVNWEFTSYDFYSIQNKNAVLPVAVRKWADLEHENPYVRVPLDNGSVICPIELSEVNDSGKTFDVIADLIEKQF